MADMYSGDATVSADEIRRYLDREGRVRVYPSKQKMKRQVLAYLASKFEPAREYTEREVNELLRRHHTFDDWALLRRDLFDNGLLDRASDGARYWRARGSDGQ
jgi:hypothetical protein